MRDIIDFLTSTNVMDLASDPRVLFFLFVLFVVAVLRRWTFILLLLFAGGGILAVVRYTDPTMGAEGLNQQMLFFVGGILVIAIVLIYFLFIRGD
jgi:hypothetical protein